MRPYSGSYFWYTRKVCACGTELTPRPDGTHQGGRIEVAVRSVLLPVPAEDSAKVATDLCPACFKQGSRQLSALLGTLEGH